MKIKLHVIETVQSVLLFGVSTWFTCTRFVEFASGGLIEVIPFVALGFGFETTRISLWIRSCMEKHRMYRLTALFLTVLSVVASLSKITASLEFNDSQVVQVNQAVARQDEVIKAYDDQIAILMKRLAELPVDYVTAANKLQVQIDALMDKREDAMNKAIAQESKSVMVEESKRTRDMFDTLGAVFKLEASIVKFMRMLFMALIAIGSEIGLLISSQAAIEKGEEQEKQETREIKEEYEERKETVGEIVARIMWSNGRAGIKLFPSFRKLRDAGAITREEEYADMRRTLQYASVLYKRHGKYWSAPDIEKQDIKEAVEEYYAKKN